MCVCVCVCACMYVCMCATVAALLIDAPRLGCVAHRKRKSVLLFFDVSPSSLFLSSFRLWLQRRRSLLSFSHRLFYSFHPCFTYSSLSLSLHASRRSPIQRSFDPLSWLSWPVGSPCPGHRCNEEQACAPLKTCFEVWNTPS